VGEPKCSLVRVRGDNNTIMCAYFHVCGSWNKKVLYIIMHFDTQKLLDLRFFSGEF